MRFINGIYTATSGILLSNKELGEHSRSVIAELPVDEPQREKLLEAVEYFLIGERTRRVVGSWPELNNFARRAAAFEAGADAALHSLAEQIQEEAGRAGVVFDAVFTTTSTGGLMPGLSYRLSKLLGPLVRPDSMQIDLGHVGCTGGVKLLNLVRHLDDSVNNCLVVSVELPTTLINLSATEVDVWQGNCTFGDGAAALWVSRRPGQGRAALALSDLQYCQYAQSGLDLIRWGYSDYYTFHLADDTTFNRDVRSFVRQSMSQLAPESLKSANWAIHPAGITLLIRLSKELGLNRGALRPSADHYKQFSNMSSAGVLHIIRDIDARLSPGEDIHLLTMGAGFNVIYGRLRKER